MAERQRRRRGGQPQGDKPRRRQRRGGPPPETRRRRRRGASRSADPGASAQEPGGEQDAAREESDERGQQAAREESDQRGQQDPSVGAGTSERSTAVATDVTLPQLGESVTEGTITNWLVSVGDEVEADQPLFELSSDKIDTEVPSPASGVLTEIRVDVDETVDVGTVVAVIGSAAEGDGQAPAAEDEDEPAEADGEGQEGGAEDEAAEDEDAAQEADGEAQEADGEAAAAAQEAQPEEASAETAQPTRASDDGGGAVTEGALMSPIVRRIAREHGIDVSQLSGSGRGGRITRDDVEAAVSREGEAPDEQPAGAPAERAEPRREPAQAAAATGERERVEDLTRIRQRIASRMRESLEQTAQLTTVQEADVSRIMQFRSRVKDTFRSREGVSLSPFVFLCRAAVLALRRHPTANAQADWDAGKVTYREYVNLGIAVDTDKGLLVPNVKGADDLTLAGLARGIAEVAGKARGEGKLEMPDIEGGTFTMTNTGSRGVLIDTPILNYPEVAILGTGAIQRRPVVVADDVGESIAIRDMVYLSLTYDHQLLDGADAARFVTDVKEIVETHDWESEVGY